MSTPVPATLNRLNLDSAPMCFTHLHNKSEPFLSIVLLVMSNSSIPSDIPQFDVKE